MGGGSLMILFGFFLFFFLLFPGRLRVSLQGTDGRDWWKEHHQGEVHSYTTCGGNCYGTATSTSFWSVSRVFVSPPPSHLPCAMLY